MKVVVVAAVLRRTANRTLATVCLVAVVAVVVIAAAVMVPTKINSTDREASLSHHAFDKMTILSVYNAILPLSGITQKSREQAELEYL